MTTHRMAPEWWGSATHALCIQHNAPNINVN